MAIRGDSYGSVAEVLPLTRIATDEQTTFNSTTIPTLTEVEKFIDRASGILNGALNNAGFTTPVTNTTAKLALDEWAVRHASMFVEYTQHGLPFGGGESDRYDALWNLETAAQDFVDANSLGWKRLGVTVSHKKSEGLMFTGLDIQSDRTDPDDTSLEQPKFKRGQWDN